MKMKENKIKFGDKVLVKTGKRKIEEGFVWKIRKRKLLIALNDGFYVEVKPSQRKLLWKYPSDKWIWEELK